MPLPEGYRPREGDELLVRATVVFDVDADDTDVHLKMQYTKVMIPLGDIHALHCRRWRPEERVQEFPDDFYCLDSLKSAGRGVVIATFGTDVWVRMDTGALVTRNANDLKPESRSETNEGA